MGKNRKEAKYTAIDLFCGIGGFRTALDVNGIKTVFSSDIDKFAQETYLSNFGERPFGNIRDLDLKDLPKFDILTGGFPCQPFSSAGNKKGFEDQTRGTLFFDILRIIKSHRPKMFLLENVKGLKSHKTGSTMSTILDSLKTLGYDVHWKILNSYDFGVPQYRERWYCVGFDKTVDFEFPNGNKKGTKLLDILDKDIEPNKKNNLSSFELERIRHHFKNATPENPRVQHDNSKYGASTKKGKHGIYSFQKSDGTLRFHVGDVAKTQIQEAYYCCKDSYAPTIIANRTPKLWDIGRKLTVNEARRLQGFPEGFTFPVSDGQAYKQLGNAVTVNVIEAIIKNMILSYEKGN